VKTALYNLAHTRSGDKGDVCNIGIIARRPEYWPVIRREVTAERVKRHFDGLCLGPVERYELANLQALNFVLRRALDGGGLVSLRLDTQGKTYGYGLLRLEVDVPDDIPFERLV
jgi:hypothetical protein